MMLFASFIMKYENKKRDRPIEMIYPSIFRHAGVFRASFLKMVMLKIE